jgi:hypothetical protein
MNEKQWQMANGEEKVYKLKSYNEQYKNSHSTRSKHIN